FRDYRTMEKERAAKRAALTKIKRRIGSRKPELNQVDSPTVKIRKVTTDSTEGGGRHAATAVNLSPISQIIKSDFYLQFFDEIGDDCTRGVFRLLNHADLDELEILNRRMNILAKETRPRARKVKSTAISIKFMKLKLESQLNNIVSIERFGGLHKALEFVGNAAIRFYFDQVNIDLNYFFIETDEVAPLFEIERARHHRKPCSCSEAVLVLVPCSCSEAVSSKKDFELVMVDFLKQYGSSSANPMLSITSFPFVHIPPDRSLIFLSKYKELNVLTLFPPPPRHL
ncbi:hypothetical protein PRIPAC_96910, partial [Pristionchus pacificus]